MLDCLEVAQDEPCFLLLVGFRELFNLNVLDLIAWEKVARASSAHLGRNKWPNFVLKIIYLFLLQVW